MIDYKVATREIKQLKGSTFMCLLDNAIESIDSYLMKDKVTWRDVQGSEDFLKWLNKINQYGLNNGLYSDNTFEYLNHVAQGLVLLTYENYLMNFKT